jgi:hypothetical protein
LWDVWASPRRLWCDGERQEVYVGNSYQITRRRIPDYSTPPVFSVLFSLFTRIH